MAQLVGEASGTKIPVLAKGHGTVPAIEAINDHQTQGRRTRSTGEEPGRSCRGRKQVLDGCVRLY
jgi:hypothetical protein